MKKLFFFIAVSIVISFQSNVLFGQKRPVKRITAPVLKPKAVMPAEVEAAPVKEKAVEVSPAQGFFNQGLKCEVKDYDCQISNYTKAINLNLNTKEVFKNRGNAYLQRKDFDKAVADFTKLLELDLNDTSGYKNRGRIYLENAKSPQFFDIAIRDFTSAIDLEPKDVEAYNLRSKAYLKKRDYEKATIDLDKIIALEPNNVDAVINRGEIFLARKDFDRAFESFNKAIAIKPVSAVYLSRGNAYVSQKKFDLALDDFNKAIQLEPKKEEAYFNRGQIFEESKKLGEAISDYSKAIELNANYAQAYEYRGRIYLESKDYKKAIDDASKAITLKPNSHEAYRVRMLSHYNLNDNKIDESYNSDLAQWKMFALLKANQDIAADQKNVDAYKLRASIYRLNGENQLAINDLQKAIEIEPKNADLYGEQGLAHLALGFREDAKTYFSKAIELNPNNVDYYFFRFLTYDSNRIYRDKDGLDDLTKAIELQPQNVNFYWHRANFAASLTEYFDYYKQALEDYDKVIELSKELSESAKTQQISLVTKIVPDAINRIQYTAALKYFNERVQNNPGNTRNYLLRAKFGESTWEIHKWFRIEIGLEDVLKDYLKCSEMNNEYKEFCLNSAANFNSRVEAQEAQVKREKKEKRSQAFLTLLGAINNTLSEVNQARGNSVPSTVTPRTTTSSPQPTSIGGIPNSGSSTQSSATNPSAIKVPRNLGTPYPSPSTNMEREVNELISIADTATTCEQGWEYANKINYIVNNGGSVPLAMAKTHVEKANQVIADLSVYLKCK